MSDEYSLSDFEGIQTFLGQCTGIHMVKLRDNITDLRGCKNDLKGCLCFIVSGFRNVSNDGQEKESHHPHFNPLRKRLVLGTMLDRQGCVDG